MERDEAQKILYAVQVVIDAGHGSVEVIVQDHKILDIVKKERERIS